MDRTAGTERSRLVPCLRRQASRRSLPCSLCSRETTSSDALASLQVYIQPAAPNHQSSPSTQDRHTRGELMHAQMWAEPHHLRRVFVKAEEASLLTWTRRDQERK
ncbi:hypothetical protein CGCF415_v015461 [Colletotrichum fructicola]|uniref:Uncharacterized protein n=1 Tax=Colletotrichum fructicola (strain Nara gc5) TaxID=1213859 RepID=A0A7J6ICQ5_COLFN|nr:uncharacterized protein CGMCC3_g17915 [Colletotrichum fructicola]KAF4473678.1 hypothetical protein CGGC5_v017300 [Colletotrichum fructicola Nara gc5]KAE9565901.1 hypothetical protein CGMCC3_g17915 [Colletotrichum fructicola]KAF4882230.1 hypothetical protein CGCFRS4_v014766 [Colletotrichum fructicola]KAF4885145.1 hypothetical protein CGCF415_v015461 [Colletotrichum fructicola]KAF4922322.1 hypothetical protein CGCF245_v015357 [Colletotrichum fructicola]